MISIGYVGVEAFDIILYIGKTLSMLNYPVLIIDLSDTEALYKTIYHGMDIDSANQIIHYRNLNYIRKVPKDEELNEFSKGILFVVYGFNYIEIPQLKFDFLNIIVDPFPNSACKVNKALCNTSTDSMKVKILVRNIVTIDDFDRVNTSIIVKQGAASSSYLYYDIIDYENALKCQISQGIFFKNISSKMKRFILSEICDILPSIKPSIIKKTIRLTMKGEKGR